VKYKELAPSLVENAVRLVKHWLDSPQWRDVEATWAYDRLKPVLQTALAQIPSLYYFKGD
jgi:hypothetical protein